MEPSKARGMLKKQEKPWVFTGFRGLLARVGVLALVWSIFLERVCRRFEIFRSLKEANLDVPKFRTFYWSHTNLVPALEKSHCRSTVRGNFYFFGPLRLSISLLLHRLRWFRRPIGAQRHTSFMNREQTIGTYRHEAGTEPHKPFKQTHGSRNLSIRGFWRNNPGVILGVLLGLQVVRPFPFGPHAHGLTIAILGGVPKIY
jgi:hypothetical protein